MDGTTAFIRLLNNPFKFRLYLFTQIPSAFFSGIRVREIDEGHSVVTVPYKWFSRNPFRSTYFACLSMAAEMSTGVLAMSHVYKRQPAISMLVVSMEANYFKKATGITRFCCTDGLGIKTAIERSIATNEGQTIKARSLGTNKAGEEVAEFFVTWSFKVKAAKK
ncbi:MAG TPA: DUF4442 domain-containing protein [Puia sp.]|nr:DUF4442 domain-containing protein [Puia sp.]